MTGCNSVPSVKRMQCSMYIKIQIAAPCSSLCCLSFELWILTTPLVSSNSSYNGQFSWECSLVSLWKANISEPVNYLLVFLLARGPLWSWSYGSWIYNYLCNPCLSSLLLWVRTPVHGEVYSIQQYAIKCVSDLRQFGGFLRVLRFPPPIKSASTI